MARYPSGVHGPLPGDHVDDVRVRLAQMTLAMEEHPVGNSAPCANPECTRPVDYLGVGHLTLHCSGTCRSRVSTLRQHATQQLHLLERTLEESKHLPGVPRTELRTRARKLRWWLARLTPADQPREPTGPEDFG
ncbi:hypothetical protein [Janibacter sp. GS2]|uniref:hypothetical protein n=1 Tax=Janibacter sp. GS2 TaxID=3442646 RepID=UPI003EB8DC6D